MKLSDISLVSQGIKQSQNNIEQEFDSATKPFDDRNTLAGQAVQESQNGLRDQFNQATSPFESKNLMIDQGMNQVKTGLANQINAAKQPFENKNSLISMAMGDMGSLLKDKDDAFSLSKIGLLSKQAQNKPRYNVSKQYDGGDSIYGY